MINKNVFREFTAGCTNNMRLGITDSLKFCAFFQIDRLWMGKLKMTFMPSHLLIARAFNFREKNAQLEN
jgi:hypothetical protein